MLAERDREFTRHQETQSKMAVRETTRQGERIRAGKSGKGKALPREYVGKIGNESRWK
jgi:hypothetical protein